KITVVTLVEEQMSPWKRIFLISSWLPFIDRKKNEGDVNEMRGFAPFLYSKSILEAKETLCPSLGHVEQLVNDVEKLWCDVVSLGLARSGGWWFVVSWLSLEDKG
ncbi:hypothetical protein Tco_1322384, partial [Tanacetum coccineum]